MRRLFFKYKTLLGMDRLSGAKIYKIYSPKIDRVYIGSTWVSDLRVRLTQHLLEYWKYNSGDSTTYLSSFEIFRADENAKIMLVEKYPCESKDKLLAREQYWIDKHGSLAVNRGTAFARGEFVSADPSRGRDDTCKDVNSSRARSPTPVPSRETFSVPSVLGVHARNNNNNNNTLAQAQPRTKTKLKQGQKMKPTATKSKTIPGVQAQTTMMNAHIHPSLTTNPTISPGTLCVCGGVVSTNPQRHQASKRHQKYIHMQKQVRTPTYIEPMDIEGVAQINTASIPSPRDKIVCACGATMMRSSYLSHLKTPKHSRGLASLQKI